mgnify:CR=1 FL=1
MSAAVDQLILLRRGMILASLAAAMGAPTAAAMVELSLRPFFMNEDPRTFDRDVAYLAGKGLVSQTGHRVGSNSIPMLSLTPAGQDVVDGTAVVVGVRVETG